MSNFYNAATAWQTRQTKREAKACMACGKPFMRSISKAGNIEAITVFHRRECCSKSCAATLRERRGPPVIVHS